MVKSKGDRIGHDITNAVTGLLQIDDITALAIINMYRLLRLPLWIRFLVSPHAVLNQGVPQDEKTPRRQHKRRLSIGIFIGCTEKTRNTRKTIFAFSKVEDLKTEMRVGPSVA